MKKLYLLFAVFACFISTSFVKSQTVLAPGDLFFTGYNSRPAVNNSNFSFVLLRNVVSGTTIRFTDKGWYDDGGGVQGFLSDVNSNQDGVITWTAPAGGVICGTEIRIRAEWDTQLDASVGTVTGDVVATGAALDAGQFANYISLNGAGDQIFAFQGTVAFPTLLCGIDINGGWLPGTTSATVSSVQSAQPTVLASHTLTITPETDNGKYNCPTAPTSNTKANLYSSLRTLGNWVGANDPTIYTLPTGCTWTVTDCVPPGPEINVQGNGNDIADGDVSPTTTDHTDFGSVLTCTGTIVRTFTIQNTGAASLSITGVTITGAASADFTVTSSPASSVSAGGNTTFQVTFNPSVDGVRSATINIANTDANEGTYDYAIQGTGNADVVNPTITFCPSAQSIPTTSGCNGIVPNFTSTVTATDNCGAPTIVQISPAAGSNLALGSSVTVTVVGRDASLREGTCTFSLTTVGPEINVQGNSTNIVSGDITPSTTDHTDFGNQSVCSGTFVRTFTIQNAPGTAALTLAAGSITITGADAAMFTVGGITLPASVATTSSTTFTVTFNPSSAGLKTATVNIASNDCDESPYTFSIQGSGVDPEIDVQGNSTSIPDGDITPSASDHTDFGNQSVCTGTLVRTYTIQNTGTANLTIGAGAITVSGGDAAMFTVGGITLPATIVPAGSTTFTVTFDPTSPGLKTTTLNIANNDCDENPYNFSIQGTGIDPEINLKGNGASIVDNDISPTLADHTEFGSQSVCTGTVVRTFTIENTGTENLTIGAGAITLTGTDAAMFSIGGISLPATIAGPGSATFTVTFNPSSTGSKTATVNITNNDCNENPYNFDIQGTGIEPEANIKGNGNVINNGDFTPSSTDHTDFGNASVCTGTIVRTFTIENLGNTDLLLTSVTILGTHASDFSLTTTPSSVVFPLSSTTFQITFNPSALGIRIANLIIPTNDCNENPYEFSIQGTGVDPEINLQGNSVTISDGDVTPSLSDHTDFGNQSVCSGSSVRTYTIQNTGTADLTIGAGAITVSGGDAAMFTVGGITLPATIAAAGSTTFTVTFDPTSAGLKTTSLNIANNDCDENPYNFSIQGTGIDPEIDITGNSVSIADGDVTPSLSDHTDFGSVAVGGNIVRTFTLSNSGTSNLTIGAGAITMTGTDAAMFTVGGITLPATVAPSGSTTFTVTFSPSSGGLKTATVNVANNDCNEAAYDFAVQGNGLNLPEIDVRGNFLSIADGDVTPATGDGTNFGDQNVCSGTVDRTFKIYNTGGIVLNITAMSISGTHAADFTFTGPSLSYALAAGDSVPFTVTFNPSASGIRSATFNITSDDSDEAAYDFAMQGNGTDPEANVTGNSISILDGDAIPSTSDHTDFGSVLTCTGTIVRTFTIENTGNGTLIPGTVTIGGTHASDFSITATPAATVAPSGNTTFQVTFNPSGNGLRSATVSFSTNDCDENPYNFSIQGTGNADVTGPSAVCNSFTLQLNAGGTASVTGAMMDGGSTDNCGVTGLSPSPSSFTCANVGANTVTLTVSDAAGNTSTCTGTVTVQDTVKPIAACQNITAQLNGAGSVTVTGAMISSGSTDACGIASLSASPNTFTCVNVGANTVTLTVTDNNGNSKTCSSTVTVQDTVKPVTVCQNITAQLNAAGSVTITGAMIDGGSTDACGIASRSASPNTFTCANVGANTVTLTVTDVNGNSKTCTSTVTVQDTVKPIANCQNITAQLNAAGSATITGAMINSGSTDACGIASLSASPSSLTCANVGANTVTLTVTDNNGNAKTCTSTVTVQDTVKPLLTCPSPINVNVDPGDCSASVVFSGTSVVYSVSNTSNLLRTMNPTTFVTISSVPITMPGFTINGCASFTQNPVNGLTYAILTTSSNRYLATLNLSTGVATNIGAVTPRFSSITFSTTGTLYGVSGDGDPSCSECLYSLNTATAASTLLTTLGNGDNGEVIAWNPTDNMIYHWSGAGAGPPNRVMEKINPTTFAITNITSPAPTTVVTGAVYTGGNNFRLFTQTPDVWYTSATGTGTLVGTIDHISRGSVSSHGLTVSDNCTAVTTTSYMSGATFPTGTTTVSATAVDASGNSQSCSFPVTVTDNSAPTAICQNVTVYLNAAGSASVAASQVNNGSSDPCGISGLSVSPSSFNCANTGSNTVTLTVTDVNTNSSTCTATVTVLDTVKPVANCQNITAYLNAAGSATVTGAMINGGSTDACGIASLSASPNTFTCANVGANTVTLTVTDNNGNSKTCTSTVTVQDTIKPTAICQNITAQLNAAGSATVTGAMINGGSTDACGIASLSASPNTFTCANVGANTVTLTVTDNNGNSKTCSSTVTVQDTVKPTAICQNITAQLNAAGSATVTGAMINGGSTDACGIASLSAFPNTFTCANVGANTVTLTVTDNNGNSRTCTSTVTVQDTVKPVANCQNITAYLNAAGTVAVTGAMINSGSTDACGIASLSAAPSSFTCANIGANTVTLTVTDVNGNSKTCTSTVTVQDTVKPAANCQNITAYLNAAGSATITGAMINGGSTDACGIASLSASPNTFTCANVGANTVTLTVTDVNGNTKTCNSTVTVMDTIDPTANCQNITAYLNAAGTVTVTGAMINSGSTDACGIASLSASPSTFTCANVGANTVTLTVTDVNSNIKTCTSTVTVVDSVDPTANCQNITAYLNAAGTITVTGAMINSGSTDACGIASLATSPNTFTCANVGANTVTLTVTDVNGNTKTCNSTVTVQDTTDPTANCQNITVYLNAAGTASVTGAMINSGSADACGIDSLSASPSSFTCANVGVNSVTLTVTDVNSNINTCTSTVTVLDSIDPTANCQNITVYLDAAGAATVTGAMINSGSTDACGIATLSASPSSFSCAEVGANTVTLTVTDVNGNTNTCTGTVSVMDTIDPTANCQNITAYLNAAGSVTITGAMINAGSADACGIATYDVSQDSFSCAETGLNPVTLTVTDIYGNSNSCSATVEVLDTLPPTAVCQDITVYLDAGGDAAITVAMLDGGSSDVCGIDSLYASTTIFSCAELGSNSVTLTTMDLSGNLASCTSTVTVLDTIPPTAVCTDITVQLPPSGLALITPAMINGGFTDNCAVFSLSTDIDSLTCADFGPNTVILTGVDSSGNSASCTAVITIVDTTGATTPVFSLGPDSLYCDGHPLVLDPGAGFASYNWNTGATTQTITVNAAGIYFVDVTTPFGCSGSDTIVIDSIQFVPGLITTSEPLPLCMNDTLQLDAGAGYLSYTWSNGDVLQQTNVWTSGTYSVEVLDSGGCLLRSDIFVDMLPFVDPNPVILPASPVYSCDGQTVTLDAGSGYSTYQWSNGATTQMISTAVPGTFEVLVTNGFGCSEWSDPVDVVIATSPVVNVSFAGGILSATPTGAGYTYQWLRFGVPIPGATASAYTPVLNGTYTCVVTSAEGCSGEDSIDIVVIAVTDPALNGLDIYPNPTDGTVFIRPLDPIRGWVRVTIIDMYGHILTATEMDGLHSEQALDFSRFASGVYNLRFETETGRMDVKIIRQ